MALLGARESEAGRFSLLQRARVMTPSSPSQRNRNTKEEEEEPALFSLLWHDVSLLQFKQHLFGLADTFGIAE